MKVREYKKLFHENKNQKKAEVAILISDKRDFKKEIALKKLKKKKAKKDITQWERDIIRKNI